MGNQNLIYRELSEICGNPYYHLKLSLPLAAHKEKYTHKALEHWGYFSNSKNSLFSFIKEEADIGRASAVWLGSVEVHCLHKDQSGSSLHLYTLSISVTAKQVQKNDTNTKISK